MTELVITTTRDLGFPRRRTRGVIPDDERVRQFLEVKESLARFFSSTSDEPATPHPSQISLSGKNIRLLGVRKVKRNAPFVLEHYRERINHPAREVSVSRQELDVLTLAWAHIMVERKFARSLHHIQDLDCLRGVVASYLRGIGYQVPEVFQVACPMNQLWAQYPEWTRLAWAGREQSHRIASTLYHLRRSHSVCSLSCSSSPQQLVCGM